MYTRRQRRRVPLTGWGGARKKGAPISLPDDDDDDDYDGGHESWRDVCPARTTRPRRRPGPDEIAVGTAVTYYWRARVSRRNISTCVPVVGTAYRVGYTREARRQPRRPSSRFPCFPTALVICFGRGEHGTRPSAAAAAAAAVGSGTSRRPGDYRSSVVVVVVRRAVDSARTRFEAHAARRNGKSSTTFGRKKWRR